MLLCQKIICWIQIFCKEFLTGLYTMRLDKFLKVSRLIKRRTVATELCHGETVFLNRKIAKPSALVKVGDEIEIQFGTRLTHVRVLTIPDKAVSVQQASQLYCLLSASTPEAE
jgi:ribosomal 50S subunit-recycling heat shock protein